MDYCVFNYDFDNILMNITDILFVFKSFSHDSVNSEAVISVMRGCLFSVGIQ